MSIGPTTVYIPSMEAIKRTAERLAPVVHRTPYTFHSRLSKEYDCEVYVKREDLQRVRSYKLRGAYNRISQLDQEESLRGVVCASAGNHAQGVALSCKLLNISGIIYMPVPTPAQKIEQVGMFGQSQVEVRLVGDSFDDAYHAALLESEETGRTFIHPFDDQKVIEGQATVGLEILEQSGEPLDFLFLPVGGGGLAAGVSSVFRSNSSSTRLIGVEPAGAPSFTSSVEQGKRVALEHIEKFVDGAAVKRMGELTLEICRLNKVEPATVREGAVCQTILEFYNKDACVVEPAGAMSLTVLEQYREAIKGKRVACVISGGNNDITRTSEIKERALLESSLKHYFIVRFPQRAGALKEFVAEVLGPDDDITHFEYTKKTNRENGSAVVGIELKHSSDLQPLIQKMKERSFFGDYLNDKPELFQFLV
ncbi:threonine ammonia-lyase IlvA [Aureitalea marina]|uniref:L-threonine dehydratase n=1 Tax=Aureitalea marina TaxID=930804 RepID=A0A2S7KM13_9FLAO|nr:threonine ammonia-lyase IlvA [Aureitalea marina]PQB03630.1 threonine dehydratase [Aureitalea marina]